MSYKGVKALVTGADGFIGSHLTEALVARGARVTALSLYNSFDSHGWLDDLPCSVRSQLQLVRGDVRDAAFVRRLAKGQDVIFHLAALIAIPHSYIAAQSYVDTNIVGTLNVLEAAREVGVGRVIQTSTSEVYGTALRVPIDEGHPLQGQSPYSASKIGADMMSEAFARSFDLPVVILRPFNTYGPRQSERAVIPTIIRQALDPSCPTILIGDTTCSRDLTFVEDTVAAFLAVGEAPTIEFGRPYNAGSEAGISVGDLIGLIQDLTGSHKPVETEDKRLRPPNSEVRALLSHSGRLAAETGWKPGVGLPEGLKRTISWWRERLQEGRTRREREFIT